MFCWGLPELSAFRIEFRCPTFLGRHYFEAVEFLKEHELSSRHYQNYLALCPNHAAMFQHANGSRDSLMEMLKVMDGNEIEVILAQRDDTIYFTKIRRLRSSVWPMYRRPVDSLTST